MEASLLLRIISIFILSLVSFIGIAIPLYLPENSSSENIFLTFKALSAGVMVGLALVSYYYYYYLNFLY